MKPLKMPAAKTARKGNASIWLETELLTIVKNEPNEQDTKKAKAIADAKRSDELKAQAKARAQERKDRARPAAETAAEAWQTYKEAKQAGDNKKAGHFKAYAIKKAKEAIAKGNAEKLPKRLRARAENLPTSDTAARPIYRLYIYKAGKVEAIEEKRTAKQAENAKNHREKSKGITCRIIRGTKETPEAEEAEQKAAILFAWASHYRHTSQRKKAEETEAEAIRQWKRYEDAGGKLPNPAQD